MAMDITTEMKILYNCKLQDEALHSGVFIDDNSKNDFTSMKGNICSVKTNHVLLDEPKVVSDKNPFLDDTLEDSFDRMCL